MTRSERDVDADRQSRERYSGSDDRGDRDAVAFASNDRWEAGVTLTYHDLYGHSRRYMPLYLVPTYEAFTKMS